MYPNCLYIALDDETDVIRVVRRRNPHRRCPHGFVAGGIPSPEEA